MILRMLAVSAGLSLAVALCRFTVRDVGFVDLGDPRYQYYTFVSDARSPGVTAACRGVAEAVFAGTNIDFAVVDPDGDGDHPARRHLRELKIERFPTTVLVHPDGQAIELPLDGNFDEVGARVFESAASSTLRQRITEAVLRHYCVVLLVECDDAKQNQAAVRAVRASFTAIGRVFDRMPKDVGLLPELIALPRAEQADEKVLLWSLGIEEGGRHPVVTILTGRVRKFGQSLDGERITEDSVLGILAKVGESCECGLDRSWMRGLRVPLRWDGDTRQLAVDLLGFDPENPLVKSEISSILSRGLNGQTQKTGDVPSVADLLLGYSEAEIAAGELTDDDPAEDDSPANGVRVSEGTEPAGSGIAIWMTLGGLLLASLGIAAFVLLRVRQP